MVKWKKGKGDEKRKRRLLSKIHPFFLARPQTLVVGVDADRPTFSPLSKAVESVKSGVESAEAMMSCSARRLLNPPQPGLGEWQFDRSSRSQVEAVES